MTIFESSNPAACEEEIDRDVSLDQAFGRVNSLIAKLQVESESSKATKDEAFDGLLAGLDRVPEGAPQAVFDAEVVDEDITDQDETLTDKAGDAAAPTFAPSAPSNPSASPEHGDDEMTSYMRQLMERVTGKAMDPAEAANNYATLVNAKPIPSAAANSASTAERPVTETAVREPAKAPECKEMMSTFRELASQSASTALNSHACRCQLRTAGISIKLGTALSVVSIGVTIASMTFHSSWMYIAGVVTLALGCVALLRAGWCHWALCRATRTTVDPVSNGSTLG